MLPGADDREVSGICRETVRVDPLQSDAIQILRREFRWAVDMLVSSPAGFMMSQASRLVREMDWAESPKADGAF